jgi:hypothetical protein
VIKNNFSAVVLLIIAISVLPMAWEIWQAKREAKKLKA